MSTGSGAVDGVNVARLRELASAAQTKRAWEALDHSAWAQRWEIVAGTGRQIAEVHKGRDAVFIAAANPEAVLWLLDRIEEAQRLIEPNVYEDCMCELCTPRRAWLASVEETP